MKIEENAWHDFGLAWQREWLIWRRQYQSQFNGIGFFMTVGLLLTLTLANLTILPMVGSCLVWMTSLLTVLLLAPAWFAQDVQSGYVDLWLSQGRSLWVFAMAKLILQWLVISPLLAILGVMLGWQLGLPGQQLLPLALGLWLASLGLVAQCGFGAAITAQQSQGAVLATVLIMPLTVPFMLFGVSTSMANSVSLPGYAALLAGLSLLSLMLMPIAIQFVLKIVNH